MAFSGHKLYAPFGAGVLAGRADWLNGAAPYLRGGGATAKVTSRQTVWAQGAARHEAGSPNVIGAIAIAAACSALDTHRDAIEAHEDSLADAAACGSDRHRRRHDLLDLRTRARPGRCRHVHHRRPRLLAGVRRALGGVRIGVRDGKFCAHLLVEALPSRATHTATTPPTPPCAPASAWPTTRSTSPVCFTRLPLWRRRAPRSSTSGPHKVGPHQTTRAT